MELGDYVVDSDDDDPDLAVVVNRPETSIDEWTVTSQEGEERTVAEDNPDYDPDDPAVTAAFVESGLNQHWPEWTEADPTDLYEGAQDHDVKLYTFPESRLTTVSDERAATMLADATVDIEALRARLDDADWDIERDTDGSIVAEKMGEQYRIHPTGEIEGEGQIREPLENIVAEYTD